MNIKIITMAAVMIILLLNLNSIVVNAVMSEDVELVLYISEDPNETYTTTANLANITDEIYSNYNLTIAPFIANNTNITGRIIAPFLLPDIIPIDSTDNITLCSFFRLNPDNIMSGISKFWLRLPIENLTTGANVNIRIYRSWSSPITQNITYASNKEPIFSVSGAVGEVYNITENISVSNREYINSFTFQNMTLFNETLNFTWAEINAPLFPNEWYIFYINVENITNGIKLLFSQCDFGNDEIYNSWISTNTTDYYFIADMDTSIIATRGMGAGIAGATIENNATYLNARWNYNISYQESIAVTEPYINVIIPLYSNRTITVNYSMTAYYGGGMNTTYNTTTINGRGYIIDFINLTYAPFPITPYILIEIWGSIYNMSSLSIILEAENKNYESELISIYDPNITIKDYGFSLFAYINAESGRCENINITYVLIPMEEPETVEQQIILVQKYLAFIEAEDGGRDTWEIFGYGVKVALLITVGPLGYTLITLLGLFLMYHLTHVKNTLGPALISIGIFIWEIITDVWDAAIWLVTMLSKSFYMIIVILVYYLGILSTMAICLAFSKSSKSNKSGINFDIFRREINNGWSRVYMILTLLFTIILFVMHLLNMAYNIVKVW